MAGATIAIRALDKGNNISQAGDYVYIEPMHNGENNAKTRVNGSIKFVFYMINIPDSPIEDFERAREKLSRPINASGPELEPRKIRKRKWGFKFSELPPTPRQQLAASGKLTMNWVQFRTLFKKRTGTPQETDISQDSYAEVEDGDF